MNEFIEIEVLTESGIIYNAGELARLIKELNSEFTGNTESEIYNCSQIKKICNYIQPQYGFEHTIYQIVFLDKTERYISQAQYKKLREVLLNTKK